ncbi:response regulator [Paenibacillus sp. FSL R7-0048]|jgi:two-component system response regulator CpxR|uniref:response regulator n=1 Tax=Paenibacillus TaxID=44249 RepID=UPI00096FA830|nr:MULTISPECIES: response regulator [Paenibacillus]MDH6427822.1 two-component system response regulator CpxR [Paenibacillus sp. PastH-4]MDH6444552.1 two-component system response regulator CpxR [Paenibacillus sp. PastF-4]MDH6528449.1 two-component system response regulator CpxR [Paenibacillus sp. PastH-3]OMD61483.1 response regulator [Paenibacillus odorifer]OMD68050.1 response regulator [Paenibacillus odorifer]
MQKVMVVDDEEVLRMLIVDTLEDLEDVEIHTAENGLEALSKLSRDHYDLVILDYMMPEMTGIEVLGQLDDEKKKATAILMLTAKAQDVDRLRAVDAGARYFMPKPFSPMELLQIVEGILSDKGKQL